MSIALGEEGFRVVFAALLRLSRFAPSSIPRINALVRWAYFRETRKVARSDLALTIAMPPIHEEVEYAIPIERAPEALQRVRALIDRESLRVNFVVELRFVAADEAWMSPAFGQRMVGIHFTWKQEWDRVRPLLSVIAQKLDEFDVVPHWGKLFEMDRAKLEARFPKLPEFRDLVRSYGGESKFGYADVNEDLMAYGLLKHAHLPEMASTISKLASF